QFFCSAGVEQDSRTSLPHKLLLFGFGFFILISVSAYVANLAAFLTLNSTDDVKTMDEAVAKGYTICAHPAVKAELQVAWPDAKFYFHEDGNEFPGILDDFDANKCSAMAVGYEDTSMDEVYLTKLCERNLVYTDSIIAEIPIAFPIRSKLASGFSYWMYEGERRHDVSLQIAKDAFPQDIDCRVHFSREDTEGSEYDEITVNNMFFPLMFFVSFAVLAVLLQLVHQHNVKQGRRSLVGRRSTLDLFSGNDAPGRKRKSKKDSCLNEEEGLFFEEDKDNADNFDDNKEGEERDTNELQEVEEKSNSELPGRQSSLDLFSRKDAPGRKRKSKEDSCLNEEEGLFFEEDKDNADNFDDNKEGEERDTNELQEVEEKSNSELPL
ncbi:hypothetical protein ACHAXR_010132, partial [Thalassiosira sp. AJA248-18]